MRMRKGQTEPDAKAHPWERVGRAGTIPAEPLACVGLCLVLLPEGFNKWLFLYSIESKLIVI